VASCTQVESLIQAQIDGELTAAEHGALERHLDECEACAKQLVRQRESGALLTDVFADHRLQRDLRPLVMGHLPEADHGRTSRLRNDARQRDLRRIPMFLRLFPVLAPVVLVVLGLAIFFSWPSGLDNAATTVGMVTSRTGAVSVVAPESLERSRVGLMDIVHREFRYETPENSTLELSLAGPSAVRLAPESRVKVSDDRRVRLERGKAWLKVNKSPRTFRVVTPTGDITVWGTTFGVEVLPSGTLVTVEEGEVTVEYGPAFAVLRANSQVLVEQGATRLMPRTVAAEEVLAWAAEVAPDVRAVQAFSDVIKPRDARFFRAEQYFVLDIRRNPVHAVIFRWEPDRIQAHHAGYDVYFYDDHMEPLMIKHIDGRHFATKSRDSYELNFPDDGALENVNVLHLKVVPDRSQGEIETTFTEVFWVPAND